MNIQYITPFIQAAQEAILQLFALETKALTPYLVKKDETLDWDISAIIGIAGEARGLVVLSFPSGLAQELTGILRGAAKTAIDDDVVDTVGEVVNIIAGNAKKGLEQFRLLISLPSIVQGPRHQVLWPSGPVPIITIPFSTSRGHFSLSVGLEDLITL